MGGRHERQDCRNQTETNEPAQNHGPEDTDPGRTFSLLRFSEEAGDQNSRERKDERGPDLHGTPPRRRWDTETLGRQAGRVKRTLLQFRSARRCSRSRSSIASWGVTQRSKVTPQRQATAP